MDSTVMFQRVSEEEAKNGLACYLLRYGFLSYSFGWDEKQKRWKMDNSILWGDGHWPAFREVPEETVQQMHKLSKFLGDKRIVQMFVKWTKERMRSKKKARKK